MKSIWQRLFQGRVLAVLVLVFTVSYFLSLKYAPSTGQSYHSYEQVRLHGSSSCDVTQQACIRSADGIRLQLEIPDKPSALKPFAVTAQVDADHPVDIQQVNLIFTMQGMQMGELRQALQANGSLWRGQAILPICTTGRRDWRVQVEVMAAKTIYVADYDFALTP